MGGLPHYQVALHQFYRRALQVGIRAVGDNRRLFDTVHNNSDDRSTPALMQSAVEGFPGPNGAARRIELKQDNG